MQQLPFHSSLWAAVALVAVSNCVAQDASPAFSNTALNADGYGPHVISASISYQRFLWFKIPLTTMSPPMRRIPYGTLRNMGSYNDRFKKLVESSQR